MGKKLFSPQDDESIKKMYQEGLTLLEIALRYGIKYKQPVEHALTRMGVQRRKDWKRACGVKNGAWKGGTRIIKGYLHKHIPEHRLSRKDGWVAIHRLVMEEYITDSDTIIHHIDGNRLNNSIENLQVYKNNGVHRAEHSKEDPRDIKGRWIKK